MGSGALAEDGGHRGGLCSQDGETALTCPDKPSGLYWDRWGTLEEVDFDSGTERKTGDARAARHWLGRGHGRRVPGGGSHQGPLSVASAQRKALCLRSSGAGGLPPFEDVPSSGTLFERGCFLGTLSPRGAPRGRWPLRPRLWSRVQWGLSLAL